jgi:uncharacterized protein with PQ loop repeat
MKFEALVGIAGILGLVSFSTLIQKIYDTHNTTSLPWTWVALNITAQLLSMIYGIANGAYGIYIPNSLFLLGLLYILYVKVMHKPKNEKEAKERNKQM